MRDYRKIIAWQKADDLTVAVYVESKSMPREELYGLTSQIRRAAYSVPANIAEGASRSSKKDYLHFLYIARGSLAELSYFIHLCHRLDYINEDMRSTLDAQYDECSRTLTGLIKSVEREAGPIRRTIAKVSAGPIMALPVFLYK